MVLNKQASYRGDADQVLSSAKASLVAQGFVVERENEYSFTARGPGMWRRQPLPLQGISRVQVNVTSNVLSATAELEALRSFQTLIIGVPLVMDAIASIVCGIVIAPWVGALVACGTIVPYAFIGPLIARILKKRTEGALESVLRDAAGEKNAEYA